MILNQKVPVVKKIPLISRLPRGGGQGAMVTRPPPSTDFKSDCIKEKCLSNFDLLQMNVTVYNSK